MPAARRAGVRRCFTFLPMVRTLPTRALEGVLCSCRYLFRLGAAGHHECAARRDVHYWTSRITARTNNDLRSHCSGPAGRGAGPHRENWPEVGPVLPVGAP